MEVLDISILTGPEGRVGEEETGTKIVKRQEADEGKREEEK